MHGCTARCPAGHNKILSCCCKMPNVVLLSVTMRPQCSVMCRSSVKNTKVSACSRVPAQATFAMDMAMHCRSPTGACEALAQQDCVCQWPCSDTLQSSRRAHDAMGNSSLAEQPHGALQQGGKCMHSGNMSATPCSMSMRLLLNTNLSAVLNKQLDVMLLTSAQPERTSPLVESCWSREHWPRSPVLPCSRLPTIHQSCLFTVLCCTPGCIVPLSHLQMTLDPP